MDKKQLILNINAIDKEAERQKVIEIKRYCDANNPYKVGDVFTDHIGSVKIEKIKHYISYSNPCCVYFGLELKKDGNPRNDLRKRDAYQCNEKK